MLKNTSISYSLLAVLKDGQHIAIPNKFELYSQAVLFRDEILQDRRNIFRGTDRIKDIVKINIVWEKTIRVEMPNGGNISSTNQEISF